MEEPQLLRSPLPTLSPCSSGTKSNASNSPEFEFWMLRNPSFPQPNLLSADELFSDGVLLPLHHLQLPSSEDPPDPPSQPSPENNNQVSPSQQNLSTSPASLSASPSTSSKRWKDIFKKSEKRNTTNAADASIKEKEKEKKKEKKGGGGSGGNNTNGVSAAELNINIWPFTRSRSAGNGASRPRIGSAGPARKVNSAPCSRSNSAGESKSRKWPSSPARSGVHLGRSSPVWQVRRGGSSAGRSSDAMLKSGEKGLIKEGNEGRRKITSASGGGGSTKGRVLNLNVPVCIGYRHHLSCRSDENSASAMGAGGGGGDSGQTGGGVSGEGVRGSNLFNLRSLFTKKVY